jgi:uncharacterized membrane protein
MSLSAAGLIIAALMSGSNIFTDVARKKAVQKHPLIPVTFWCQVSAAIVFGIVLVARMAMGAGIVFRDGGNLFGIVGLHLSPAATYSIYLSVDVLLVSVANILYFLALQVSPLSLCVPFLAFTPIFLIPTGFVMLRELPPAVKLLGVVLVFIGSVLMHRRLFAVSWAAPIKAIVQERGSRYMLTVALIFSITNPLEKKLVLISDVYTQAFAFGVGLCLFFFVLTLLRKPRKTVAASSAPRKQEADYPAVSGRASAPFALRGQGFREGLQSNVAWISAAGALDGISLLLQFASYHYIDVVISISIKRAGIVLAVFFGWLFFRERGIPDKLIASSVMLAGVLIIYLPVNGWQGIVVTAVTLVGAAIALYATRTPTRSGIPEEKLVRTAGKQP